MSPHIFTPTQLIKKPIPALDERIIELEKSISLPPFSRKSSHIALAPETKPQREQIKI